MSEREGGSGFFTGMFLGGIVGAAIGLLLASKAGEETLQQLQEKGSELRSKGRDLLVEEAAALREVVDEVREILREAMDEGKEVLKEALAEGREATAKATEELHTRFDAARGDRQG